MKTLSMRVFSLPLALNIHAPAIWESCLPFVCVCVCVCVCACIGTCMGVCVYVERVPSVFANMGNYSHKWIIFGPT